MVAVLKSIAAIAAVGTNVKIMDSLGGHVLDLANNRGANFQPVQAANAQAGIPHQQFHVDTVDPVAGTFRIVHTACNFHSLVQPVARRAYVDHSYLPMCFESSSGLAVTLWRYNPGTVMFAPATFEPLICGDPRQSFTFVAA
ncbi:hypothetical protein C8J57DRAFT_1249063 [Mycena rebaudengoi]|nr:hypothetical protein C8J57DRAFT_1249063 [Mycena rebaudengoi]